MKPALDDDDDDDEAAQYKMATQLIGHETRNALFVHSAGERVEEHTMEQTAKWRITMSNFFRLFFHVFLKTEQQ